MAEKKRNNKIIIRRDWRGKIKEVELDTPEREPDGKPILELIETVASIFISQKEDQNKTKGEKHEKD